MQICAVSNNFQKLDNQPGTLVTYNINRLNLNVQDNLTKILILLNY